MYLKRYATGLVLASLTLGTSAMGTLLVYEPFDYGNKAGNSDPQGNGMDGRNGGFGFTAGSSWNNSGANWCNSNGGLTYGILQTSGNKIHDYNDNGGNDRNMRPITQLSGDVYGSFLVQLPTTYTAGNLGLLLESGSSNQGAIVFRNGTLVISDAWVTDTAKATNSSTTGAGVHLVVFKMNITAGNDTMSVYLDPDLSAEPSTPTITSSTMSLDAINNLEPIAWGMPNSGAYYFDELRIGTTYRDVVPIPEPSSVMAIVLGSLVLLPRRRR